MINIKIKFNFLDKLNQRKIRVNQCYANKQHIHQRM
ncbi:MAG: hypothetical protein MRECE_26c010 [Mycoplasmataceae bacterium CE_OT135]|nr:MAG: hypothetical protein MRECE_26c010 [Mycoplasmataceae bacterium CE_OT135]